MAVLRVVDPNVDVPCLHRKEGEEKVLSPRVRVARVLLLTRPAAMTAYAWIACANWTRRAATSPGIICARRKPTPIAPDPAHVGDERLLSVNRPQ